MDTVTLQVPMSKSLKNKAASAVLAQGFSSLQDAIRIFLSQVASHKLAVTFQEPIIILSRKNAERYDKMTEEIESGKVKPIVANSLEEHFAQLGI